MNGLKKTLIEMAHSNQIEVENVNSERGILFGRSVPFNVNSIIFVSAKHGLLGKKEQKENIPYERKILKLETCRIACSGSGEGITMNTAGTIRQMLGWCPNVSITRAREDERFDDTTVNAPDSGGGTYSISRWLNRYSNRILLNSCILTLSAISLFFAYGKDRPDLAMGGVISGLILGLITCVKEWHKFNKVTASEFRSSQMTRIRKFVDYMIIIGPIEIVGKVLNFSIF